MLENFDFDPASRSALLSLVVPVLNEEDGVAAFVKAVDDEVASSWSDDPRKPRLEIIFVDDGSTDGTAAAVRELCRTDDRVRLVRLSRNFGKEAALSAGLNAASGDAVVPMDVDLQDPPHLLYPMVKKWEAGAKVVNAQRTDRSEDTLFKRTSSKAFYKVLNSVADHPVAENVGDFRLLDRSAVAILNQMTETSRFNKGLFSWVGFETDTVEYARPARNVGDTKWSPIKLAGLAVDGITSSTTLPLRIWTIVGSLIALLAFSYGLFLVVYTLAFGADTPGYASIMVAVLFLGGLNLVSLGVLGEYVGRMAVQVRGRPLYIVASTEGF
jgi:glycosyltransferase involved in cell wall biosynthesis